MTKYCGIRVSNAHIDGTSLSVHGKYLKSSEVEESCAEEIVLLEELEPVGININHGYSRDHRSDLKQFTLSLLTTDPEPYIASFQDAIATKKPDFVENIGV